MQMVRRKNLDDAAVLELPVSLPQPPHVPRIDAASAMIPRRSRSFARSRPTGMPVAVDGSNHPVS